MSSSKILIGISGSIAAYKVCELISLLIKNEYEVRTIITPSALNFIGKATLEGLTGYPTLTSDFEDGRMMSHIDLAKWADAYIVAPATAQTINNLANGVGGGPLISTFLAYDMSKPFFVVPAMNSRMLEHPATQKSIRQLTSMGGDILPCGSGSLACGDVGPGRLLEPQQIFNHLVKKLTPLMPEKILITAGGTKVPIDSVRSITNTSSGATGAHLADYFYKRGYEVKLITSNNAIKPKLATDVTQYNTYNDLEQELIRELSINRYDYIFHAAAVSDYSVDEIYANEKTLQKNSKIPSSCSLKISLKPTDKIISKLFTWANNKPKIYAFKLTHSTVYEEILQAINKLFDYQIDGVIQNDISEISKDFHKFNLYTKNLNFTSCESKDKLGETIEDTFIKTKNYLSQNQSSMEILQ